MHPKQDPPLAQLLPTRQRGIHLDEPQDPSRLDRVARRTKDYTSFGILAATLRVLVTFLAVFGLLRLSIDFHDYAYKIRTKAHSCSCGNTVEEAIGRQCRFDPIASAWMPPVCRDDELIDDFHSSGDGTNGSWTYYTDKNGTGTYTLEEVGLLAGTGSKFYTTHRWHILHCTFHWRKMNRRPQTGVLMAASIHNMGHLRHCEAALLKRTPLEEISTGGYVALDADLPAH